MAITREDVLQKLRQIKDPRSAADIVTANRVRHVAMCDGYVNVRLATTGADDATADRLGADVSRTVESMGDEIRQVRIEFIQDAPPPPQTAPPAPSASALPHVAHILAVGAGKGGVGKSTVAVNLAVGMSRRGLRVGLLDGDIYGPSIPTLMGLGDLPVQGTQSTIHPFMVHGVKTMTIGKLVDAEKPLIWRGPMAHSAFRQLALQTDWGTLDYLIVDLPPGTGDVPLTMAQMLPLSGAVIVCTPQKVAQDDAVRAAGMFRQLNIRVLGVVENMSYFIGDDGREYDLFGRGGAADMATRLALPLLASIPIHMALRQNSDAGNPTANFTVHPSLAAELDALAGNVVEQVQGLAAEPKAPILTIR
jgi:ATP-binding protein involved in chromosome partitioning